MITVFLVFILSGIGIIVKAGQAALYPDPKLNQFLRRKFEQQIEIRTRRGSIVDRNGEQLAVTVAGHSLFADPKLIEKPEVAARLLAKELTATTTEILHMLKKKSRFVWIERKLSADKRAAIEKLKIKGLGFQEEDTRVYPHGRLAAQVIGFAGQAALGSEGIEKQYNAPLRGPDRAITVFKDARGRMIFNQGGWFSEQFEGHSVVLNLDSALQFQLSQELLRAKRELDADGAFGVVLEAKTARVVAIGSVPDFDPNQAGRANKSVIRNRVVTDLFEPGSVIKPLIVAGALSENVVKTNSLINCENGKWKIKGHTIREADEKHQWAELTVAEILARSSNIGTAKIAFAMGEDRAMQFLKQFGLGRKTGIDFPGEAKGIFPKTPWSPLSLATVSYGHGVSVSPLQIAAAYAVLASDGRYRRPQIVRRIVNSRGEVEADFAVDPGVEVINAKLAAQMRLILAGSINEMGTGEKARVPGYPVAGKTGTAMKVDPDKKGYLKGAYISSFVGMIPANNPEYVIYVGVDHPREEYYASTVAAPVFSRLAEFAMRHAKISPVVPIATIDLAEKKPEQADVPKKVEQQMDAKNPLIGKSLRQAWAELAKGDIGMPYPTFVEIKGTGRVVKVLHDSSKPKRLTLVLSPEP